MNAIPLVWAVSVKMRFVYYKFLYFGKSNNNNFYEYNNIIYKGHTVVVQVPTICLLVIFIVTLKLPTLI